MAAKRAFVEQLAALDQLRHTSPQEAAGPLRKALAHRSNYMVAKAADLAREFGLAELLPELLAAFDRFFTDPVKTDPQCWAKNALSRALAALDCQDAALFLRGMRHRQPEPVWGGSSDTAGALRATCALALAQCRTLPQHTILAHLIDLAGDEDKTVRADVVRAIEQVGSPSAVLLLRLRAILAAGEPEILGACYSSILSLEGTGAIPWLSRFLSTADEGAAEAAMAIAADRSPQAFAVLREHFHAQRDAWFQSVLLSAIALTRQQGAQDFLFDLVRTQSAQAEAAIEAILRSAPSAEISQQLQALASDNPRLARAFAAHRPQNR